MARLFAGVVAVMAIGAWGSTVRAGEGTIDFNRDIRPILSENCFFCHGQDPAHREAELRLDVEAEALADRGGYAAIVPGEVETSELVSRIETTDEFTMMPPADSNRSLTAGEKTLLRRWIAEGAEYSPHWAFVPPERPALPEIADEAWPRNPIDHFVRRRLENEGLQPSREMPPGLWLRRAAFDLTGLPPTTEEVDTFIKQAATEGEAAYEAAADRLLASPHYGERMAQDWMDVARYADTHGFNNDSARTMWRWRDYVIDSFNRNQSYDEFITEQLAGDLLPDATLEQKVASGFNRNHGINSEGGIIHEEYRVEYVADRVKTLGMAWLGLTLECARCHDHKFDPITQKDYYEFFAFFNNVREWGEDGRVANAAPLIAAPTQEQQARLVELDSQIRAIEKALAGRESSLDERMPEWRARLRDRPEVSLMELTAPAVLSVGRDENGLVNTAVPAETGAKDKTPSSIKTEGAVDVSEIPPLGPAVVFDGGFINLGKPSKLTATQAVSFAAWVRWDGNGEAPLLSNLNYGPPESAANFGHGLDYRILADGRVSLGHSTHWPNYAARVVSNAKVPRDQWVHMAVTYDGTREARGIRLFMNGRQERARILNDGLTAGGEWNRELLLGGTHETDGAAFGGALADVRLFDVALKPQEIGDWVTPAIERAALVSSEEEFPLHDRETIERRAFLRATDGEYQTQWERMGSLAAAWHEVYRAVPTAMVMQEMPEPRQAYVLERGQYDAHGEPVSARALEEWLAPWPAGVPRNRLGLAAWLTQPEHPLTSRVVVNRFWQQVFGTGLVKTSADFGFQGEWPSHPKLLDWLAVDFVEGGWNVKRLMKMFVLSAAYRQDAAVSAAMYERDPENRLLARGPRFRLPAELIRDQALFVSGLLQPEIGGPSVYPYQPADLYKGIVVGADYPGTKWLPGKGPDLYRRSLYTFWKRTVPHPAMSVFDAPEREVCTVRRSITNTPLQALNLLNGPIYLEASRKLAERMLGEGGPTPEARIVFAFRVATSREPTVAEARVLVTSLERLLESFEDDRAGAAALLEIGESPLDVDIPRETLAAYTAVASMILNLDEVITK